MAKGNNTSYLTKGGDLILSGAHDLCFYVGIPYCEKPCSYCHYKPNLSFGHSKIPDRYVNSVVQQLERFCDANQLCDKVLVSCYFGGGTPSLLTSEQLAKIIQVFKDRRIDSIEKSIEIHPTCNVEDLLRLNFFNRYSIGLQSCSESRLSAWGRPKNSASLVQSQICSIREYAADSVVNIDVLFKTVLSVEDVAVVMNLHPDTIVAYPITGERNEVESAQTYWTLFNLDKYFPGYSRSSLVSFHFSRRGNRGSRYAEAQYTNSASVIGFGHNSLSYVNGFRYLSRHDESGRIIWKEKDRNWFTELFYNTLTVGVPSAVLGTKKNALLASGVLCYEEKQGLHLPFSRDKWKKAVETLKTQSHNGDLLQLFKGLFWADSREKNLDVFFDEWTRLAIASQGLSAELLTMLYRATASEDIAPLRYLPDIEVLIEGVDGSGKDTFAYYMCEYIKGRVIRGDHSISIVGDPSSVEQYGTEVKRFVEDAEIVYDYKEICRRLKENRLAHHKRLKCTYPGLRLFVRSVLTEVATLRILFPDELVDRADVSNFAKVVVVKVDPNVANVRIENRGKPRTWRESPRFLRRFDELFSEQVNGLPNVIIVENSSDNEIELKTKARAVGELLLSSCASAE